MQLLPKTCDLWLIDLTQELSEEDLTVISEDEQTRLERFKFQKDKLAYAHTRIALRRILGEYTSTDAHRIVFNYGEHGKPALHVPVSDIEFNVSHANRKAVIAVYQKTPVGVDIEYVTYESDLDTVAKRFFSRPEVRVFNSLPQEAKAEAFFNCWTRKEAFIKAIGDGLSFPLDEFEVSLRPGEQAVLKATFFDKHEKKNWTLGSIELEDYKLAWAIRSPGIKHRFFDYQ